MYSLILDSATKYLYICILKDENILFEKYLEGKEGHAKNIVNIINVGLNTNNLDVCDLNEVIVGVGPGSYTGVRMAVCVAKMLAEFMPNIKLYKISTLKLLSSNLCGKVLVMIDARRNNSFATIIDNTNNKYILEEKLYENEFLLKQEYDHKVLETEYKVNPLYVIKNKELVENPSLLIPNYLRDTEAERNLHA